jgi:ABC-type amino acid transport system permease subunit
LSRQAQQLVDYTAQPYEAFIAVTVMYLLINVTVMFLMRRLEEKGPRAGLCRGEIAMYEMDWSSIPGALPLLFKGLLITFEVTITAIVVGHCLGHGTGDYPYRPEQDSRQAGWPAM